MALDNTILIVASSTSSTRLGGAIAHLWRTGQRPALRAIGAGAVNQAIKAVAIASRYLETPLACIPDFCDVVVDGQQRTALVLSIVEVNHH